jgi:hypothetical protein
MDIPQDYKPIPGYPGYWINAKARILTEQQIYRKNTWVHELKPIVKKGYNVIRLTVDGVRKEVKVARLMALAFYGPIDGISVAHKNRIKTDDLLHNLVLISKKELGVLTGGDSRRKIVIKKDNDGEVLAYYRSASEAAKKNFMNRQTVTDYCNKTLKRNHPAPDGYYYSWDTEAEEA